ncbi:MAG: ribosome biogenesis GTPase YlqF [Ruminococcaceae bacterium]|nr:ribosome biogenesis GTPase YlqF [Oscillospiraceae bacterium]
MQLQWYPGHMAKTRRLIGENLKLVDVVVEILDARVPYSSRNPDFDDMLLSKPRVVVMNKFDLSDESVTKMWVEWYEKQGVKVILTDSLSGKGVDKIAPAAKQTISEKIAYDAQRGLTKAVRIMVVGIPNVGKSSLINRLSGRAAAKTGDKPGVTRGKQWIRLNSQLEILDTPGILWPKFENQEIGKNLAFIGSIRDEIMDVEELACHLLVFLRDNYKDMLCARYKLDTDISELGGYEILEYISKKRGFVVSGGELDTYRGANIVLDEFRAAKIGRITLEVPPQE